MHSLIHCPEESEEEQSKAVDSCLEIYRAENASFKQYLIPPLLDHEFNTKRNPCALLWRVLSNVERSLDGTELQYSQKNRNHN